MNRRSFLKALSLIPAVGVALKIPGSEIVLRAITGTVTVILPPASLHLGRTIVVRHLGAAVGIDGWIVTVPHGHQVVVR